MRGPRGSEEEQEGTRGARGSERERGRSKRSKMGGSLALTELVVIPKVALTSGGDLKNILLYIDYTLHLLSPFGVKEVRWETPSQSEIFSVIVKYFCYCSLFTCIKLNILPK